jgi:hypothetical protein
MCTSTKLIWQNKPAADFRWFCYERGKKESELLKEAFHTTCPVVKFFRFFD